MQQLRGTGVALITPFDAQGALDLEALNQLVDHCIQGGVDYLVVLGTTGESATLTADEKDRVIQQVVQKAGGQLPLVLGVGGNNTQQVIDELKRRDLSAFDAILSVSPYYNRPSQEGIFQHYKAVAEATSKPLVLYNVPSRTGSNMLPATVLRLAHAFDHIIGIKEAAGDMTQVLRLLADRPRDFMVISGDDMLALPLVSAGGDGVISVIGQGVPRPFSDMIRMGLEGDQPSKAYQLHFDLMPLIDIIFAEGNPSGIKALLEIQGIGSAGVRLPLVQATPPLKEQLRDAFKPFSS
ncbi:4-hydroxy-tetrahydrodipicolinate synthase [Croceiramulus getboli]|nr:4-hydroxy-tetrahydrodipicolinate synthase [Flavobacteriaceae bacterium YJPT1-3]